MNEQDKQFFKEMEDRLIEKMRDMQTELLRGFSAHADGMTVRLRKVEVDQSNLDVSLSRRVEIVEQRLRELEGRMPPLGGKA